MIKQYSFLKSHYNAVKIFGAEHPAIAGNYNNLGFAYANKGEFNKVIEYYDKALSISLGNSYLQIIQASLLFKIILTLQRLR